ncbi:hypothetical protein [Bradyrhizobium sp.]
MDAGWLLQSLVVLSGFETGDGIGEDHAAAGLLIALILLLFDMTQQASAQITANMNVVFCNGSPNNALLPQASLADQQVYVQVDISDFHPVASDVTASTLLERTFQSALLNCRSKGTPFVAKSILIHVFAPTPEGRRVILEAARMLSGVNWTIRNEAARKLFEAEAAAKKVETPTSMTEGDFCSNFSRHRAILMKLFAQRASEQNALRIQQIDSELKTAIDTASLELGGLYGTGSKRFSSYIGTVSEVSDAGFGRFGLGIKLECSDAPIAFYALFSNEQIEDPPNPANLGLLSSLPAFRSSLAALSQGNRVQISGIFRRFVVARMDLASVSPTDTPIVLRVRITELSKL